MNDFRIKFFINISGTHLGFQVTEDTWEKEIIGFKVLEDYLENENFITLCASLLDVDDKKQIRFQKEISSPPQSDNRVVVFCKNKPTMLDEANLLSSLHITSLQGPPTTALYNALNNVFSPLIIKSDKRNANQNAIEKHFSNLQAGLRSTILTGNTDLDPIKNVDINSLVVVLSLDHEVEFWNNASKTAKNSDLRASSAALRDIIQPLARDFSVLDALPLVDVEDLLENAHNVLDDLWRHEPPYPKARIEHLMDLIASNVVRVVSKQVAKFDDVWTEDYSSVRDLLEQCISTTSKWTTTCKELTQIFWPNYSIHAWTGEPFEPSNLCDLMVRLEEVLNIRTVHRQLTRLLTANEQNDLNTNDMFKPFKEMQFFKCGPHTEQSWKIAIKQFEYLLRPAEQRIALKLKKQLSSVNVNTRQLLYEFGRYSELISRPTLKKTLQSERQYLLTALQEYVKQLTNQILQSSAITTKYDTPQVVGEILAVRQLEVKAVEVQKISEKLLNDLHGYEELKHTVSDLINNLKQQHQELFDSWSAEITAKIKNKSMSLKESDPVVHFSKDKLMCVNYSGRLVMLISEVRQLTAMGYRIPSHIEDTSSHAKRFMKFAKILEQIANFHNTIGDRMIPSQRPMMLSGALTLSRLVQDEEVVSWGDEKSVEKYVENLKTAVETLSNENNLLTSYHIEILEKIKELEDTDLIKYYQKWKDAAKSMRDIMTQVQEKGFKNLQSWKLDVDRQLCKILETQYLKSLDTVHLYLPEIYCDLMYRESHLQFSPDENILRSKYEQQLKRFVDIPKSFRGVSDNVEANIYPQIIDRCNERLDKVQRNTDNLFDQLKGVVKHWESWVTLDRLDPTQLTTWQHWDLHFRASKTFGQEIAKLPSTEERVGCFIIGLSRLRSDLESHNRSYWDQLVMSLKDSIAGDIFKLQQYVDTSTGTLNRQPMTLEQIGEADASHANILRQRPEMEELYRKMGKRAQMLGNWNREQIDSVNRLQAAWERLQSLLENHEHIIAKQLETIKVTLNIASENLLNEMERFSVKWDQVKPRPNSGQIASDSLPELYKYLQNIKEKRTQWTELMGQKKKIENDYVKFNMSLPDFTLCDGIEKDLEEQEKVWALFEEFHSDLEKLSKEEWIVFRKKSYHLEEFLVDWQSKLQKMENTPLVTRLLKEIHIYEAALPALKCVRGEDFTEKHWMEIYTLLKMSPKSIDVLCLRDFLDISDSLIANIEQLQAICKKAASEIIVRQALAELDQWDVQTHFELTEHVDSHNKSISLIKSFKEILSKIGDNQSLLQSVKNSADYESFSERAGLWEVKLGDLDQYLTSLVQIQRKWVYLEPIFGGGTLAQARARFEKLSRDFHHLFQFIKNDSRVSALCRYSNLRSVLENLHNQLGRCQKSLDEFLTEKRNKFPRFLFLGDDDLLEVVGQSSKEQVIQSHLKKLFVGIHEIKLDERGKKIIAMCSLEGEVVELSETVDLSQPVENWLNTLVKTMQSSLKKLLSACLAEGQNFDPTKYPSQILCLADSITFTTKCEQAINNMTLPPLLANYKTQLNHYSSLELSSEKDANSLTNAKSEDTDVNVLELKLKALLLDTIHHISVIEELIDANVTKINDWAWQKQLRFYTNGSDDITIKMVNAKIDYSYEYLGNPPKLVRTALTDQCFLTLTQGMHLGMGGNPYGPAGTGKTESVKALGALFGRQVLVFNCDEGIDASSMGRILSGLVRTGAWGCFDEFNRLDEATLSAVSMHIQPIQHALKNQKESVRLLEQEESDKVLVWNLRSILMFQIKVNKHCGIFVTLNPAGGSYGGRNKLPDNLKQLFRPVVMTHPDHEQIARTLLHCEGYQHADVISRKLIEIFSLARKLLSKQQHYDWGLRALKTVLSSCNKAPKQCKKDNQTSDNSLLQTELTIVVKALRINTLSKLTFADSKKFDGLVKDVFPDVPFHTSAHSNFLASLEESCRELGFEVSKRQIDKCVELFEQLKQRMGVVIVGPPSSGKSAVRNILFTALNKMGRTLRQKIFNPKSLPRSQLLGQIDVDTRQWTDGILTLYSLQVTSEPLNVSSWIVCDGNIDPEWVESLNSVLDDNKLLSLPSGWRIQFGPNVNFVFETHDLSYASPATISRMGIVFLSEEDLDIKDFVSNFINKQSDTSSVLASYVNDYFIKAINWIVSESETVIPCSKVAIASSGLSQLVEVSNKAQFVVQVINGLGGQLSHDFKEVFVQQFFEWTGEMQPALPLRSYYNKERDVIESYYTNIKQNIDHYSENLPLILTAQICQTLDALRTWSLPGREQHFLLVGPHGSGKSLILETLARERSDTEIATIHCSAHVTPQYVIHKFTQHCIVVNSNKGRIYKPRKGHLVLHFKNLHLLKIDQWGTNMLIEFLQQLITYNAFFDNSLERVGVENITVVGTLTAINTLPVRFSSVVHLYSIDLPEKEDLSLIYSTHLASILKTVLPENSVWTKAKVLKLTGSLISIYNEIKETFSSLDYQHYVFSPHEITKWCDGILRYKNDTNAELEQFVLEIITYEALKLFGDKLVNEDDKTKLTMIINNMLTNEWGKTNILRIFTTNYYVPSPHIKTSKTQISLTKLNTEDWSSIVKKGIIQYAREGIYLDVLVIPELLNLTASLSKALTISSGNALLVGRSGVGRKSALKIVSSLESAKLIVPISSKQTQFNNDLKHAMQQAAVEGEQVYLLLEDHILNNEVILNNVNTLISSGEIPGLYNSAELDSLVAGLKDEAGRESFEGNLVDFFVKRVQTYLHIVVCLEKENKQFWNILECCPALYQECSIIWLTDWSEDTLQKVPGMLIDKINNGKKKEELVEISEYFITVHAAVNIEVATPLRYINLIKTSSDIFIKKKNLILSKQHKLKAGVSKLTEARNVVAYLKLKAIEQQEKLAEKQAKANMALDMISNTMQNANVHKQEMENLKQHTEKENVLLLKRKKEIELELAEVEPLVQEARAAVGNIKPEALSEIRSLRAPPDIIRDILEGVLRLMGIQDTSWNSMKTFLAKRGVKEDIRSFDATKINQDSRHAVERLMQTKGDSFDPKSSKRASVAAAPLAAWVTANVKYSHVLDKIKPLSKEQNKLKQNLDEAKAQLGELSAGLLNVDAKVTKLKEQLSTYTKEAAEIEMHLNTAQETLSAAEGLVFKLNDEYERWKQQLQELSDETEKISVHALLAAGFITYLAGEPENIRKFTTNEWIANIGRKTLSNFVLSEFLSSEREHLQWLSEGLTSDQLSQQNAIIILNSNVYPLIIDPTTTAMTWIKTHFKSKTIEVITQDSPKFNTTVELSIRFGKVLLIEEVESITSSLFPVLRREFVYQGERKLLALNGKLVDFHSDFRLILSSRNARLKITADFASIINIVNFTITHAGLTEQLLISAIRQESPELEDRRKQLLHEREELQAKQYYLQNQLLEDLANSTGDILQNKNLLASLNETKASSSAIASALIESNQVQAKLQQEYDVFKDISSFSSNLYFAACEFSKSNVLYSISLSSYVKLFLKTLISLQAIQSTFGLIERTLIQSLYHFMGRGIFKADRLKYLLHLIHRIFPKQISEQEWSFFLGQIVPAKNDMQGIDNMPSWMPNHIVQQLFLLEACLPNVYQSLNLNEQTLWKSFMESSDCESKFPQHCKLSEFQKVLVIRTLRPDRSYSALVQFVIHITGLKNLNLEITHLSQILQESVHTEPILLLTISGNDPSAEIRELAQQRIQNNYSEIAMGEGQENKALAALQQAAETGCWLILKNIHLVTSWLPVLSQNLQKVHIHPDFRLWLVTETHRQLCPVLAQNSLKIAYEAPQGIKNNLLLTYAKWGGDYIKKLHPTAARIFFVLASLHALLQERRNYIPQGWSKWYEFSDVDLSTAVKLSEEIWASQSPQVPWKFLKGLCSGAIYGGRIENIEDSLILNTYLQEYFNDDVLSHRWRPFSLNNPISLSTNYQDYVNGILQISNRDYPSYFGLPENIDRSWEKNVYTTIITELRGLQQITSTTKKFDRQVWQRGLIPYMNLWKKLNQGQEFIKVNINMDVTKSNSISEFIFEEYRNAISLIQNVHKYFTSLNRIIRGNVAPEEELIDIVTSLLNQKTPKLWLKMWSGPRDPSKYLKEVVIKTVCLDKWKSENEEFFFSSPIDMSLLFDAKAFIAAFKLDYSRRNNIPVDELVLETSWKPTSRSLILSGLLIEGALFDGLILSLCTPSTESINAAPKCYLNWCQKKIDAGNAKILDVTLYNNSKRGNGILSLQVPCDPKEKNRWAQSGLAFFLSY